MAQASRQANIRDGGGETSNGSIDDDSVLRLRWNSHVESLQQLFENLLEQQLFVDVTLACEGGSLRAHRVMLSACSAYFKRVLYETSSKNPVIIMRDVSYAEMDFILQFIYRGEIHVPEAKLPSLLKTARLLEIRGLSDKLDKPVEEKPEATVKQSKPHEQQNGRKRRSSETTNGLPGSSPPHSPKLNGKEAKTKKQPPVPIAKEEEEVDDLESDSDEMDRHSPLKMGETESRSSPPLDLSGGASDEENEMPGQLDLSTDRKTTSPVPGLVKCESLQPDEEDDEDDDDTIVSGDQYPFAMLANAESDQSGGGGGGGTNGSGGGVVVQAVCPFCFKDCKRTAELRAHIRAHTGEKPFRCDICSAPFARSAHLKRHRRVHTGERPFECHRCQKTFSRQDKLKLHMDRHRLRDTGGKMIVGRPKKLAPKKNGESAASTAAGTSSSAASSTSATPTPTSASEMTGMGQFAFPGAPARPGPPQSPNTASSPSPYGDLNYFSLLSLSQRGLTISSTSSQQDLPSPTVPHLLTPQALQELQLFRQSPRGRPPARSTRGVSSRTSSRASIESASETLLNFAQQVGEIVSPVPPPAQSS